MPKLNPHIWITLAVLVILTPSRAPAQTVVNLFEEPRPVLKRGQTVVTDANGRPTKGSVAAVADPLWNGALIGAGIGTGLAMWDYLIDPSEPGNAAIFTVAIGLGTAIGAGVDALVNKDGKVVYASPRRPRGLRVSLLLGERRQGALVSVRF